MTDVYYTGVGAVEYVEYTLPSDVGDSGWLIALGTETAPGPFFAPDAIIATTGSVTLQLLVGVGHVNPITGRYYLWSRNTDAPETEVTRSDFYVDIFADDGIDLVAANQLTMDVIEVDTLPVGSAATAVISGVAPALHLSLGIPVGATGFFNGAEALVALGNKTGAFNIDLSLGSAFTVTLTGNATATFTNVPAGSKVVYATLYVSPAGFTLDIVGRVGSNGANALANLPTTGETEVVCRTKDVGVHWIVGLGAQVIS